MNNLARGHHILGQIEEVARLHEKASKISRSILGTEHPDTLKGMNNLAEVYSALGRMEGAVSILQKVLEAKQRILAIEHPSTLGTMNLADRYYGLGKTKEA